MTDENHDSEPQPEQEPEQIQTLAIGRILAPHGLRGEMRMQIWTHFPERIPSIPSVSFDDDPETFKVRRARVTDKAAIIRVEGISTREAADERRGAVVRIALEHAAPLEEDEFYQFQLIGLDVVTAAGEPLGTLADIIETGANDVYLVRDAEGKEVLLPALKSVILDVNLEHNRMTVQPPEYL